MTDEVTRFEIAKLELAPGDILVVKTELILSKEQTAYIETMFKQHIPESCSVMVVGGGLDIGVLKKADQ